MEHSFTNLRNVEITVIEIINSLIKILRRIKIANRYSIVLLTIFGILSTVSPVFSAPSLSDQYNTWKRLINGPVSPVEIINFLNTHPDWPLKTHLTKKLEMALTGTENSQTLFAWFQNNPPLTAEGSFIYIRLLLNSGKKNEASALIKKTWIQNDFSPSMAKNFKSNFSWALTSEDNMKRMNRLLYKEDIKAAQGMLKWLSQAQQDLVKTRIALIQEKATANQSLANTKVFTKDHPGLIFDQIKWNRRRKNNKDAMQLLQSPEKNAEEAEYADEWWQERNILGRRMIEEKRFQDAYKVMQDHKLLSGENFANAEWLLGWIQLRFLNQTFEAYQRFQQLFEKVKTPISRARAAFWAGEAAKELGKTEQSKGWYKIGSEHPATYYGQLSMSRLNAQGVKLASIKNLISLTPSPLVRKRFEERELVKVIKLIPKTEKNEFVSPFFIKLGQIIKDPAEHELLVDLAHNKGSSHTAVETAKKVSQSKAPLVKTAYPLLSTSLQKVIHSTNHSFTPFASKKHLFNSFVHAIIRQESRFNPNALSPAGAKGLMQLMPATAQREIKRISFNKSASLFDTKSNLALGASHISNLLNDYSGSLILTAAAYNAGQRAVGEWITLFGDPRHSTIDTISWIELIPYAETRNYVQRVMENFIIYQERLKDKPLVRHDLGQHLKVNLH
ncbi:MAG: lytic transglycosylase domain-containing protein [Alphaproteobacteria bacterium]|nr:lytic transglycosylase domain-containing protein [Alphaproteobacteria bacterium]